MSRDLLFWKPGSALQATRGTIALVIGDYQVEGLDAIGEARVIDR
jgi:hypothetical protein